MNILLSFCPEDGGNKTKIYVFLKHHMHFFYDRHHDVLVEYFK